MGCKQVDVYSPAGNQIDYRFHISLLGPSHVTDRVVVTFLFVVRIVASRAIRARQPQLEFFRIKPVTRQIHADQSDISLNFWITPDSANLAPESGGLDVWNVAAPSGWTFNDYNADGYRIRLHLSQIGARRKSYAYGENRGLLFNGMLFHQTANCRFAGGFENRRRNITMLFRRRK